MKNVKSFAAGLAIAGVLVVPQLRIAGIPLAYSLLIVVFVSTWPLLLKLDRRYWTLFAVWMLPMLYVVGRLGGSSSDLTWTILVRNGMALMAGIVLASATISRTTLFALFLGASSIITLDAVWGIAQFFRADWAISSTVQLAGSDLIEIMSNREGLIRAWGLHSHPHMFPYVLTCWIFFAIWSTGVRELRVWQKRYLALSASIAISAVAISGQRSAFWMLVLGLIALSASVVKRHKSVPWALFVVSMLIVFTISLSNVGESGSPLLARITTTSGSAQTERLRSWQQGQDVIASAPIFGSPDMLLDGGIHNGLISGTAHFGIIWAFLIVIAVLSSAFLIIWPTIGSPAFVCMSFIGFTIVSNTMFHTLSPTFNDMVFFVFLGAIILICRYCRSRAVAVATSPS